ncbi:MAG: hypothetical protein UR66_C0014G0020 [Candidatus Moranbacteria bacterium GW2011_GWE1_35_17]|nr:MAG: hypothetical protein UR65_C0071G0008 [Candidatus Moranbacteria bacterium GW2011_GWE2_35_164]KKP67460.1 MAG: hypothetical protein UR66_C0014G0020 [Candidatus Moranbacteria bacterium GW2011_GWE1_35_17]KKP82798.1 MAG: hypothetical protein UR82_C0031G0006 [Candidatus Moranbacteria bacterium GW2011_GWF1_35_5]KKP82807.1 MAG: hypothetical protein UR83_C0044G0005 [Candidatus Moranbacteria bacterium GW2011_GWF2_35_54]
MKILQINKFYYKRGGSETHFIDLVELLRRNNHEVNVFSTKNNKNVEAKKNDYFIDEIEMKLSNFKNGFNIFYNRQAIKALKEIILNNRPDIVHVHNISHHFSPAILKVFKKYNIPVIMTVHDYKIICPNYKLFNSKGICEKCIGGKYYQCALNKCIKDSYLASFVMMLESYWAKWKRYYDLIDIFIAPSHFMRNTLISSGINSKKVVYLPNFLKNNDLSLDDEKINEEKYILSFGRLSKEKGIDCLIKAFDNIGDNDTSLKIAGEGPASAELKELTKKLGLEKKVDFIGYKSEKELRKIIIGAQFVVVPSLWYENAPYTILESYAFRKAVLGAKTGGISELIKENETGFTFEIENYVELAEKIKYLLNNADKNEAMGETGRFFLRESFNEKKYLKKLLEIYRKEIQKN